MITKKDVRVTPFKKRPSWDIFDTYCEMPRARQANAEMKAPIDKFTIDFRRVSITFQKEGLDGSASREMAIRYPLEKLEPWRKARRLREESTMMNKIKNR